MINRLSPDFSLLRSRQRAVLVFGAMSILVSGALAQTLPPPEAAGFEHVVVVMMENRSFDHFLGWLPGANGQQAGLPYKDSAGVSHMTHALAPDYQGCGFLDPGHSYSDGRVQYDNGACDGFLFNGSDSNPPSSPNQANDIFAIGYYGQSDLPFLGAAGPAFTVCDNYFCGIMAETYPNRFYMHAAQTNAQTIQVPLVAVNDGTATSDVSIPMSILIGDVNASGLVDGNDVSAVQADTRQTANSTNFRLDVNTSGLIDGNDVSLAQSNTRTSLP
jgi:phospholipase C